MNKFTINAHPKPLENESIRGYLLRLTDINGFKSIRVFKKLLGPSNYNYNTFSNSLSLEALFERLAPSLHTTPDALSDAFLSHWTWGVYRSNRQYLQGLLSQYCRLCPLCLSEHQFYKAEWEFSLNVVCKEHQCYLIDECPHCKARVKWQGGYMHKCHHCGEYYANSKVERIALDSPLIHLTNFLGEHYHHTIEKVIVACNRVHRLGDNVFSTIQLNKLLLNDVIALLTKVSGLLFSQQYRNEYISWLRVTRQAYCHISDKAVLEPYLAFKDIYPCHTLKDIIDMPFIEPDDVTSVFTCDIDRPSKTAHQLGISPARLSNFQVGEHEISLEQQINGERLAMLLNLPYESIDKLVNEKALRPSNNIERLHRYLFNLSDIADSLKPLNLVTHNSNLITLKQFVTSETFKAFALPAHIVIELIIKGEVTLFENKEVTGFVDQFVDNFQTCEALESELLVNCDNKTPQDLATVFHTSLENVIGLYERGCIDITNYWKVPEASEHIIDSDSFRAIVNDYTSLNRACYFSGSKLLEAKKLLREQNIKPAIIIEDSTRKLYLYKTSSLPVDFINIHKKNRY